MLVSGFLALNVVTAVVTREPLTETLEALGTAKANESVTITATVSEKIEKILFQEGATVQAGDVLVHLEAAEERAQLEEARVSLDEQKRELERVRTLWEKKAQSGQKLDQQQSAVRAPAP